MSRRDPADGFPAAGRRMPHRYYSAEPITSDRVTLAGTEARHLSRVMRAAPGTRVVLFDGLGGECEAEVVRLGRGEVELTVVSRSDIDRELPYELSVGVALPKGERQRWMIEKLVELGTTRLVPLSTVRGVVQPSDRASVRLNRITLAASKQCGRNRLMKIDPAAAWPVFVEEASAKASRLYAHRGGEPLGQVLRSPSNAGQAVVLAIGPEGGFTEAELAQADSAGWRAVDLGPRTLRVETAAVFLAAAVLAAR